MSDAALKRHLDEIDRQDDRSAAVRLLKEQWLSHPERVKDAWFTVLTEMDLQEEFLKLLSERSLRSGRFSGSDEMAGDTLFLHEIDELMEQAMCDMAEGHLEAVADQNAIDAALDAVEDQEYWRDRD